MPCNGATNNNEVVNMHSHSSADDVDKANTLIDSNHENVIDSTKINNINNANSCDSINIEK